MATIPLSLLPHNAYYASLDGLPGVALALTESTYAWQMDGRTTWVLVSRYNPQLLLMGACQMADAQWQADQALGSLVNMLYGRGK